MAIDLKKISEGKQQREPRILLYGADGIGKTQWAVGAPEPFFIDLNRGSLRYNVKRVLPESWSETMEWLGAIERGAVKCKTVVIDSVGDLEHLGNTEFFPNSTIDKWDGGYGRGETYAITRWRELIGQLERVWMTGKAIILIGHMMVKRFDDPTGAGYERFEVATRAKIAGLLRQNADFVLFAREEVAQQKASDGKFKAVTTDIRWTYTRRCPAFDAKSRGTTMFPERVLLSWDEFAKACADDESRMAEHQAEIVSMLAEIGDPKLDAMVKEYLRGQPGMVVEARNSVAARLEKFRAEKQAPAATTQATATT